MHRFARQLVALPGDLARVEADPDPQWRAGAAAVERVELALDTDRARECPSRRDEHREEAVAERDLLVVAVVLVDLAADQLVVLVEQRVGVGVTQARAERGRALDVGEHQGHRTFGKLDPAHRRVMLCRVTHAGIEHVSPELCQNHR